MSQKKVKDHVSKKFKEGFRILKQDHAVVISEPQSQPSSPLHNDIPITVAATESRGSTGSSSALFAVSAISSQRGKPRSTSVTRQDQISQETSPISIPDQMAFVASEIGHSGGSPRTESRNSLRTSVTIKDSPTSAVCITNLLKDSPRASPSAVAAAVSSSSSSGRVGSVGSTGGDDMVRTTSAELRSRTLVTNKFRIGGTSEKVVSDYQTQLGSEKECLFEYFAICGLQSSTKRDRPKVLWAACHPDKQYNRELPNFCFPLESVPMKYETVQRQNLVQALSRIPAPNTVAHNGDRAFLFTLTDTANNALYCLCLYHDEVLECPPELMFRSSSGMKRPCIENMAPTDALHIVTRAYCAVTRFPYFSLLWRVLCSCVHNEHTCMMARYVLCSGEKEMLHHEEKVMHYVRAIKTLLVSPPPRPGTPMQLRSQAFESNIQFTVPSDENFAIDSLVSRLCLPALLRAISPPVLTSVLCALLCEFHVVLYSASHGRLTACALALLTLLKPFEWCFPFVPLIPEAHIELVSAPAPVFVGLVVDNKTTPRNNAMLKIVEDMFVPPVGIKFEARYIIVDLDRNSYTSTLNTVRLPLEERLNVLFDKSCQTLRSNLPCQGRICEDRQPWLDDTTADALFPIVTNILEELCQYKMWLLNQIRRKLPTGVYPNKDDVSDPALCETIVNLFPPQHRPFFTVFMQSQTYSTIADEFPRMGPVNDKVEGVYKGTVLRAQ